MQHNVFVDARGCNNPKVKVQDPTGAVRHPQLGCVAVSLKLWDIKWNTNGRWALRFLLPLARSSVARAMYEEFPLHNWSSFIVTSCKAWKFWWPFLASESATSSELRSPWTSKEPRSSSARSNTSRKARNIASCSSGDNMTPFLAGAFNGDEQSECDGSIESSTRSPREVSDAAVAGGNLYLAASPSSVLPSSEPCGFWLDWSILIRKREMPPRSLPVVGD